MRRRDHDADARFAFRNSWIGDAHRENVVLEKFLAEIAREDFVAEHDGGDGRFAFARVEAEAAHLAFKVARIIPEPVYEFRRSFQNVHGC